MTNDLHKSLHHLQTDFEQILRPIEQVSMDKTEYWKAHIAFERLGIYPAAPFSILRLNFPIQSPELNTQCPTVPSDIQIVII